jgi:hypothetical protein
MPGLKLEEGIGHTDELLPHDLRLSDVSHEA